MIEEWGGYKIIESESERECQLELCDLIEVGSEYCTCLRKGSHVLAQRERTRFSINYYGIQFIFFGSIASQIARSDDASIDLSAL